MGVLIQPEDGGVFEYVVDGALMFCSNGTLPCPLKAIPKGVSFNDKQFCSAIDKDPILNGFNFGLCAKKQKPCISCISLQEWKDVKKDMYVNDDLALLDRSFINCSLGGKITFKTTGQ
ncbi:MAG: DUF4280 domain-containing protein [Bacteroidales bacterium]